MALEVIQLDRPSGSSSATSLSSPPLTDHSPLSVDQYHEAPARPPLATRTGAATMAFASNPSTQMSDEFRNFIEQKAMQTAAVTITAPNSPYYGQMPPHNLPPIGHHLKSRTASNSPYTPSQGAHFRHSVSLSQ